MGKFRSCRLLIFTAMAAMLSSCMGLSLSESDSSPLESEYSEVTETESDSPSSSSSTIDQPDSEETKTEEEDSKVDSEESQSSEESESSEEPIDPPAPNYPVFDGYEETSDFFYDLREYEWRHFTIEELSVYVGDNLYLGISTLFCDENGDSLTDVECFGIGDAECRIGRVFEEDDIPPEEGGKDELPPTPEHYYFGYYLEVTALKAGECRIYLYSEEQMFFYYLPVMIAERPVAESITLSADSVGIPLSKHYKLGYEAYPAESKVSFASSDPSIVEVSASGMMYGVNLGKAVVTISSGDVEKTVQVTVSEDDPNFDYSLYHDERGFYYEVDRYKGPEATELILPAYYRGFPVRGVADSFTVGGYMEFQKVSLGENIEYIGISSFSNIVADVFEFSGKTSYIGDHAFSGSRIGRFEFNGARIKLGDFVFTRAYFYFLEIPENFYSMGYGCFAFQDRPVFVPKSIEVGPYCFSNCIVYTDASEYTMEISSTVILNVEKPLLEDGTYYQKLPGNDYVSALFAPYENKLVKANTALGEVKAIEPYCLLSGASLEIEEGIEKLERNSLSLDFSEDFIIMPESANDLHSSFYSDFDSDSSIILFKGHPEGLDYGGPFGCFNFIELRYIEDSDYGNYAPIALTDEGAVILEAAHTSTRLSSLEPTYFGSPLVALHELTVDLYDYWNGEDRVELTIPSSLRYIDELDIVIPPCDTFTLNIPDEIPEFDPPTISPPYGETINNLRLCFEGEIRSGWYSYSNYIGTICLNVDYIANGYVESEVSE